MDRPLDDRIVDQQNRRREYPSSRSRSNAYPRDGIRKPTRDERTNLDNDWVHDRYDDEPSPKRDSYSRSRGRRDAHNEESRAPEQDSGPLPAKLRVDNLHYDLTEEDIYDLFQRIASVKDAKLTYDRAGRSEGVAFVTYDRIADAREAIRQFDGANAKGQPIRITLLPLPPRATTKRDNPFDRVTNPRSLLDRIEAPAPRNSRNSRRSASPGDDHEFGDYPRNSSNRRSGAPPRGGRGVSTGEGGGGDRRSNVARPPPDGIDRYVPGGGGGQNNGRTSSSRRDNGGRRPGERRERRGPADERPAKGQPRPKKTQEELDAEMEDYWSSTNNNNNNTAGGNNGQAAVAGGGGNVGGSAPVPPTDDIDMIE